MQIILTKQCESFTGSLGKGFGYHIVRRKNGFFGRRDAKGTIPPDGHWRFIVTCAELTKYNLHIADIRVSREELRLALYEAKGFVAMNQLKLDEYRAADIINLKTTFSL